MNVRYVVGNWKLNPKTKKEASKIISGLTSPKSKRVVAVVCPPAVFFDTAHTSIGKKKIFLGAQDISAEEGGAYTGAISALMFKEVGATFAIVGHSEIRALGENDELVNRKLRLALKTGITPVLCVGEIARSDDGSHLEFLKNQLTANLKGVSQKMISRIVFAYEPVFAVGAPFESALQPNDVHEMALYLRKVIGALYTKKEALSATILYGGAVSVETAGSFVARGGVAGVLVGRGSLVSADFNKIVQAVAEA